MKINDAKIADENHKKTYYGKVAQEEFDRETAERADEFKKKTEGFLSKSFDHHDVAGDGVLSPAESKVFFGHLVSQQSKGDLALVKLAGQRIHRENIRKLIAENNKKFGPEMAANLTKEERMKMQDDFKQQKADLDAKMQAAIDSYKVNKDGRDAKAFEALDVAKDGKISKSEFLAAFEEGSDTNKRLTAALGLDVL